jgi:hypothetical protein
MSTLVQKLSQGHHPVEISLRPNGNAKALKECIDRGYVHVKFTDTQGGTELGVKIDKGAGDLNADFDHGVGNIQLVGNLTLDYVRVQCVAAIDVCTLTGQGYLVPIQ